jgi:hypothetical protein
MSDLVICSDVRSCDATPDRHLGELRHEMSTRMSSKEVTKDLPQITSYGWANIQGVRAEGQFAVLVSRADWGFHFVKKRVMATSQKVKLAMSMVEIAATTLNSSSTLSQT